ncbi:hypothetical protein GGI42DRAFT_215411 [Trichoderma sp. SZMC 28013]
MFVPAVCRILMLATDAHCGIRPWMARKQQAQQAVGRGAVATSSSPPWTPVAARSSLNLVLFAFCSKTGTASFLGLFADLPASFPVPLARLIDTVTWFRQTVGLCWDFF